MARLISDGHWKQARLAVEHRLTIQPDDPELHFFLSQVRNAFGDRSSPLTLAGKAVALSPKVGRYHRQLAEVQGVMAQHASAFEQVFLARRFRKEIDAAVALDPRDVQAMRDLLEFYLLAPGLLGGDLKKAEVVADKIGAVDQAEGLLAHARIAAFHKNYASAERLTRRAAELAPGSYDTVISMARFHMAREHFNESGAASSAWRALDIEPKRIDAYAILAPILAGQRDWSSLDTLLDSAVRAVPDDPAPFYRAAERLISAGVNQDLAEQYLRRYLEQEPEGNQPTHADARWLLGLALEAEGNRSGAIQQWTQAVRQDPASPAGRDLKRVRQSGSTALKGGHL